MVPTHQPKALYTLVQQMSLPSVHASFPFYIYSVVTLRNVLSE